LLGLKLFNDATPVRDNSENRQVASKLCGLGSVVGIDTGYGLDGPGSKLGGGEISAGEERSGRDADPSPPSSDMVKKE